MKEIINNHCDECGGKCCKLFGLDWRPVDEELAYAMIQHQSTLLRKKDILKSVRWMKPASVSLPGTGKTLYECTKLVDGKCSVYNIRPSFCKIYGEGCIGKNTFVDEIERIKNDSRTDDQKMLSHKLDDTSERQDREQDKVQCVCG